MTQPPEDTETRLVWIYRRNEDELVVFATADAAEAWFEEHNPEGVAFAYEVIG